MPEAAPVPEPVAEEAPAPKKRAPRRKAAAADAPADDTPAIPLVQADGAAPADEAAGGEEDGEGGPRRSGWWQRTFGT